MHTNTATATSQTNKKVMSLETSILIAANPDQVWDVLLDFNHYPNWNPFIQQVEGRPQPGEGLKVTIHPPGKKPQVFKPTVLIRDETREFRWLGHLFVKGLFDGEHYFRLEPLPDGGTRFIHGEIFSGLLAKVLMGMMGDAVQAGFEAMNQALKERVENNLKA